VILSNCILENGTRRFAHRKHFDILAGGVKTDDWLTTLDEHRTFLASSPPEIFALKRQIEATGSQLFGGLFP